MILAIKTNNPKAKVANRGKMSKNSDKRLRRRVSLLTCPPPTFLDIQTDQAEISLFLSISRFLRIIRDIKRSLYRKPQHVWKTARL